MKSTLTSQKGAFLVLLLIIVVAVLGFAALSLDVGRVVILRAEMQNAVDAAALAAAKELDGTPGARARAVANARHALEHNSHFARVSEILGEDTLIYTPGDDTDTDSFTFFCVIGSNTDVDPSDPGVEFDEFCAETDPYAATGPDNKKYVATTDKEANYVRIQLLPEGGAVDNFSINLLFLPILELFGGDEMLQELALTASALAGRNFFACNYPPLMICNPFENSTPNNFDEAMNVGESIELKQQGGGGSWAPGNFGFLTLDAPGASSLAQSLANEGDLGCTPAIVTSEPGGNTNQAKSGINTRFGIYNNSDDYYGTEYGSVVGGMANSWETYPPAPSVARYPPDNGNNEIAGNRFGNGEWDCLAAWQDNHGGTLGDIPANLNAMGVCTANTSGSDWSRWDMYNWELDNLVDEPIRGYPIPPNSPDPDPWPYQVKDQRHDTVESVRDRRRIYVAVLDCEDHGVSGKTTAPVFGNDGFAEIFIIGPATGSPDSSIYGEYLGWGDENTGSFHVDVKLYE